MSAAMANGITIGAEALSACVMLVVLFTMLFENKESGKLVKEAEINMYDDKSRYYQMEGSHKR